MESVEQIIKREKNLDLLREYALLINAQAALLAEEVKRLKAEKAKSEAKNQEWLKDSLRTQLNKLRRRFFEHGRETMSEKSYERRAKKEEQLLLHAESLAGEPTKSEAKDLPTEEMPHFLTEAEVILEAACKDASLTNENAIVTEVEGFCEKSTEITITERIYRKVIHKRQKYKVKNKSTGKETIVTAPGPVKLAPGCRYSIEFALKVAADKFLNHLPYERQRKEMKRQGLNVPVMTLFRLNEQVALHMQGVYEDIRLNVFKAPLACHLDETPWPILSDKSVDGRMWILSNQAGSYYRFEPTRSGRVADELLKGYRGKVLTDKFSGYLHLRDVEGVIWGLCWSHARREFFDLEVDYPDEVKKIVNLIDDLFDYERKACTWDELSAIRQTKSKMKAEEIKKQLHEYRAEFFDNDDFCKAINYVLSAWHEFTLFIEHVELPLSNNDAERALRQAVLGRKNFRGSKTINGADVAATMYTVIESCKKVELDPIAYMKYVIYENQSERKPLSPLNYAKSIRGIK
jgi:transposase